MLECVDPRPSQGRADLLQNSYGDRDSLLLVLFERVPPEAELVCRSNAGSVTRPARPSLNGDDLDEGAEAGEVVGIAGVEVELIGVGSCRDEHVRDAAPM